MAGYFGSFALGCGFFAALAGTALWWRVARSGPAGGRARLARQALLLVLLGAVGAVAVLEWALLTHDFSVRYVAEHGSRATPAFYTATSLWSALDGSLLLWLLVLAGYALALGRRVPREAEALHPWAMVVVCGIAVFFFGLSLFAGNAFDVVQPVPPDGPGPNPLLADHPAMAFHPPLLYLGFVGLAVPFAFALAALITGEAGSGWLRATRSWTLSAWCGLTAGIVLGGWWSYAVLGWGGYWAWDPVENASLLPWLVATALLHSSTVQRRRAALPAWNVTLAAAGFLLVCVGTFLTRSDVLASVHSFTRSPIGPLLLGFLVVLLVVTAVLLVWRVDRLGTPRPVGPPVSRGSALLVNNLLLLGLTGTVLIGTLFPLVAELVSGAQLSVGPPYFDRMAVPLALVVLLLMAVGPMLRWTGDSVAAAARRAAPALAAGAAVVGVLGISGLSGVPALLAFGLAVVVATSVVGEWVGARSVRDLVRRRRRHGALVAHLGVAVLAVGVAASSSYTTSAEHRLGPGQETVVHGVPVQLTELERVRASGAMTTAAHLELDGGARVVTSRLSYYPAHGMTVSNPAIRSSWTRDVYVTLLEVDPAATSALLRVAVNPLVTWIWAGGTLMLLGAGIAGLPARRRSREPGPARGERTGEAAR